MLGRLSVDDGFFARSHKVSVKAGKHARELLLKEYRGVLSTHSKAIGHAGKEQCREKTDLKKDGGLVACQEDEETTEAAEGSRHYRVATHKLGHSVHPGG